MTRIDIQNRIRTLREELEARHKSDTVKTASVFDGKPATTQDLQSELFSLTYKLSKLD